MRYIALLLLTASLFAEDAAAPTYVLRGKKADTVADAPKSGGEVSIADINKMREEFDARVLAMAVKVLDAHKSIAATSGPYAALKRAQDALRMEYEQLLRADGDGRFERGKTVFYHAFQTLGLVDDVVAQSAK